MTVPESLLVSELFYSIQGESTRAGLPCAFIRLAGCNLRCNYCDASYTWNEPGEEHSITDILQWLKAYPGVLTEITGGEPLLQENIHYLIERLIDNGHQVLIETNGTVSLEQVHQQADIIMDIKCPGSGMGDAFHQDNINLLRQRRNTGSRDEIKFVLCSEADFQWALEMVKKYHLYQLAPVLFSPVTDQLTPPRLAELILAERLPIRLQLQLHSLLWPNQKRGV
ncbi:MAG TPA: radical SAM protein [Desulfobulbaceae bacterium]|nr:radical SAM protein [Desulfobulbaceae bacterium]